MLVVCHEIILELHLLLIKKMHYDDSTFHKTITSTEYRSHHYKLRWKTHLFKSHQKLFIVGYTVHVHVRVAVNFWFQLILQFN